MCAESAHNAPISTFACHQSDRAPTQALVCECASTHIRQLQAGVLSNLKPNYKIYQPLSAHVFAWI